MSKFDWDECWKAIQSCPGYTRKVCNCNKNNKEESINKDLIDVKNTADEKSKSVMNKIKKGKQISNISSFIGITSWIISLILNWLYQANIKNNLQGTDKIINEMGAYNIPTYNIALIIGIIGIIIFILGRIIGFSMCKCPKCGYHIMTRFGSLPDYCPKCGKLIS